MELLEKTIEEMIGLTYDGKVSCYAAKMAIKGAVDDVVSKYEEIIKSKDEQIRGYKSALKLADEQNRGGLKEKVCKKCGKTFKPHSGAQAMCDTCRDIKRTAKELAEA